MKQLAVIQISSNLIKQTQDDSGSDSYDELDEDDVQQGIVNMDTMLDEQEIPQKHFSLDESFEEPPDKITFAPGEGQNLSLHFRMKIQNT